MTIAASKPGLKPASGRTFSRAMQLAVLVAMTLLTVQPSAAQTLFKSFDYGATRASLNTQAGIYPCEGEHLCLDDQTFLDYPVDIGLILVEDRLSAVVVDLSRLTDPYNQVLMRLAKSPDWQLVNVKNPSAGTSLDLLELYRKGDLSTINTFEMGAIGAGSVAYTFVEVTPASRPAMLSAATTIDLLLGVPSDTRTMNVSFSGEESFVVFAQGLRDALSPVAPLEKF